MTKKYHQLTEGERNQIYALHKEGLSPGEIGSRLGRHASTIYREFQRNTGGCGYRPIQAQRMASERRSYASTLGGTISETAGDYVLEKLTKEQWSPEQISGRIYNDIGEKVSHEWIYQYIYADRKSGGELYKNLRHGRRQRKKRCNPGASRAGRGHIKNRRDIDERPKSVENRNRFGHWEIDTIIGKSHSGAAVTIVERKTRFTILIPLQNRKSDVVAAATIKVLDPIRDKVKSITADNGKEFATHEQVAESLGIDYYFAKPYHSWERGTNENANGLIRQYIPKDASIADVTIDRAQEVMDKLNNRPRKILGYRTPAESFARHSGQLPSVFSI